ncbi:MAG TPA: hypothetical protein VFV93_16120, partial [Thermomicrobiales bacterium]|nr:hypothetical protein [Thermomicrobiales bacterium]
QLVAWDLDINVLEVVLAGATDDDSIDGHLVSGLCKRGPSAGLRLVSVRRTSIRMQIVAVKRRLR